MQEELERCVSLWRTQIERKEKEIEKIRGIKHDMEAHFVVLRYYLDMEKYEDARKYLKELGIQEGSCRQGCAVDLGNPLLNELLCGYLSNEKDEISLLCTGSVPKELDINDYELCVLFSNVLSNALEACRLLKKFKKEIRIEITQKKDVVSFYIENPKEWFVDEEKLGTYSTKENTSEHGYGIKNVKRIVDSLGGQLKFHVSEDKFGVKILLPL